MDNKCTLFLKLYEYSIESMLERKFDNVDLWRFPKTKRSLLRRIYEEIICFFEKILNRFSFVRLNKFHQQIIKKKLVDLCQNFIGLSFLYENLADQYSKNTLIEVLAYRVLGFKFVKLSRNNKDFLNSKNQIENFLTRRGRIKLDYLDGYLDQFKFRLSKNNYCDIICHRINLLNTFLLEQYSYSRQGAQKISVDDGDIVVDGGGCWGDSGIYFADKTGNFGKVHVFEFNRNNLDILEKNLNLNAQLKHVIDLHTTALWNESNCSLNFAGQGPSSTVGKEKGNTNSNDPVITQTIDDWFFSSNEKKVDFIKLDIEGAEVQAIEGARRVIRQFKPKLAIALYHSVDDFVNIPRLLKEINPGYSFFLDHFTIHEEETILFAINK